MFKSARYYFRKKSTEKKTPIERRDYICTKKELLDCMDLHIKSNINDNNYKPSNGFNEFCRINLDLLKEEITNLCKNGFSDSNEIKEKIPNILWGRQTRIKKIKTSLKLHKQKYYDESEC
jgi:hypothetical protein